MFSIVQGKNPDLPAILLVGEATALSAQGHREDSLQLFGVARFKPPAAKPSKLKSQTKTYFLFDVNICKVQEPCAQLMAHVLASFSAQVNDCERDGAENI